MIKKYVISGVPGSGKKEIMKNLSEKYANQFYFIGNAAEDLGFNNKNMDKMPDSEIKKSQIQGFRMQQDWEKDVFRIKNKDKFIQNASLVNWYAYYHKIFNFKDEFCDEMAKTIKDEGNYEKIFFLNGDPKGPVKNMYIHNMLLFTYRDDFGFKVLQEPGYYELKDNLEKRAEWILSEINK